MAAAPMWRMNGLWRRMAGVLVLCALLLSNEVMCEDPTTTPAVDPAAVDPAAVDPAAVDPAAVDPAAVDPAAVDPAAVDPAAVDPAAVDPAAVDPAAVDPAEGSAAVTTAGSAAAPAASAAPGPVPTVSADGGSAPSAAPKDKSVPAPTMKSAMDPDSQNGDTLGTTAAAGGKDSAAPTVVPDKPVVPTVKCVEEKDIPESNVVKADVTTNDCEATKRILLENPAPWCHTDECNLEIFQNDNKMLMTSKNAKLSTLAKVLQGESLKDKLGVTKTEVPSSSGSSVFVGILVSGLLSALGITMGYFKRQQCKSDTKGVRLAEEAYPADQENQGNTLVSVAPLNPPPETQEKPSVNGESPEAAKTQPPPPTNGHSTTKTADTEL